MTKQKKTEYATKEYVDKTVAELGGTLVEDINIIIKNMATKDGLQAVKKELKEDIDDVKLEIRFMKDDVKGLTEELAMTPSRNEFRELKEQVRKIYLSN